jgi:hypothetical protein
MLVVKKLFKYLLIVLIFLGLSSFLWIKKIPLNYLSSFIGKMPAVDKHICTYTIQVGGNSMAPIVYPGSSLELNRCFTEADLSLGTLILFTKDSESHLAIIRHILPLDPVVYKVSNERPHERLQDIVIEEIAAINKSVDTSRSSYQPPADLNTFIINPNEYVSDLYLGKIPRGYGLEMADVERTSIF